jgi:hypothetical protein
MITVFRGYKLQRKCQNDEGANGHTGHYRANKLGKPTGGLLMLRLVRDVGDDLLGLGLFHTVILQGLRVTDMHRITHWVRFVKPPYENIF